MKTKRNEIMKAYWNGISGQFAKWLTCTAQEAEARPERSYITLYWCNSLQQYVTVPESN